MKKIVLSALFMAVFAAAACAQQSFSKEDFAKNIGKKGTLCDVVGSYRVFSDTLALVNMGAPYPEQKYTVAVKGAKIKLDWDHLKGKKLCVTGVFEMFKGRPEIQVSEPDQVSVE